MICFLLAKSAVCAAEESRQTKLQKIRNRTPVLSFFIMPPMCQWRGVHFVNLRLVYFVGGTNSLGSSAPEPKKYCSICSTRNCWASGLHGCKRYSFSSIFWCSPHIRQASALTFS